MQHIEKHQLIILAKIFFIVFTFVPTIVDAKVKASLSIRIVDCRDSSRYTYLNELTLLKKGKVIKKIIPKDQSTENLLNLDTGTYTLKYQTIFMRTEYQTVVISVYKNYSTNICLNFLDYSKESYKPIIDRLKDNESYEVLMSSEGCFGGSNETWIIKRVQNVFIISWGLNKKTLSEPEIDVIRKFEFELNCKHNYACTTADNYRITYNSEIKTIVDGSCHWIGYYYLKNKLLGVR